MTVNRPLFIGLLKCDLIYILLEKDPKKQNKLFQKTYDEISENIVPAKPDRHYRRAKGQLTGITQILTNEVTEHLRIVVLKNKNLFYR